MLKDEEIKAIIERSFSPFSCAVEILPGDQIRFKVLDKTVQLYEESGLALSELRYEAGLATLLTRVRESLVANGHLLDPW